MWKKFVAVILVVFGFASAANAGTEVIRDYGSDQFNNYYAPPPPRPVYYAPPPPVNVLIFPAYGYYGPRFGVHRYYGRRVFVRPHYY
jgi:hypothetical protein